MKITIMRYWEFNDNELQEEIYTGTNPYEACHELAISFIDDAINSTLRYEIINNTNINP